ncbi:hypothetical protein BGZ96_006544 [Linnemannia gamsii]|uniref:Uncharacterized protein n=1 Tax=Linnemannia gamsii TaxID=64522 RepID=A0ABQ7K2T4_9FUNG|nr:hypothetical protein BGZ96_006544 [Linnemannia gamsii]
MVHPGIIVISVFGVVVTGVVLYTILKDEIHDIFTSFEKESPVGGGGGGGGGGGQRERGGGGFKQENDDFYRGQSSSSSMYDHHFPDYELRQRRPRSNGNQDDDDEEEKDYEHDMLTERFRRINETERAIAANETRLAEMERSIHEREEALQESIRQREVRMEQAMREAEEQFARQDQERAALLNHHHLQQQQQARSAELYQNPFAVASHDRLITADNVNNVLHQEQQTAPPTTTANDTSAALPIAAAVAVGATAAAVVASEAISEVDPRPADAILRHDLSSNYQLNVNPFEDPSSLLENAASSSSSSPSPSSSRRSSIRGSGEDDHLFADADDRSVTIGRDSEDEEELDWTEAEIGSIGSNDSEDSWGSP